MARRKERPDGFVVYGKSLFALTQLPDELAGQAVKAAARFFLCGEEAQNLDLAAQIVYGLLQADIKEGLGKFSETVERNRAIAQGRRLVTTRDDSSPVAPKREESEKKRIETKRECGTAEPPAPARFVPPTEEEVRRYAEEQGLQIDCAGFCDYYAARGWNAGKSAMQDWRAAVRTWARRDAEAGKAADGRRRIPNDAEYLKGWGDLDG